MTTDDRDFIESPSDDIGNNDSWVGPSEPPVVPSDTPAHAVQSDPVVRRSYLESEIGPLREQIAGLTQAMSTVPDKVVAVLQGEGTRAVLDQPDVLGHNPQLADAIGETQAQREANGCEHDECGCARPDEMRFDDAVASVLSIAKLIEEKRIAYPQHDTATIIEKFILRKHRMTLREACRTISRGIES